MKKFSDYKGDEAIELWADLLTPISTILEDNEVRDVIQSGASKLRIAQSILKKHKVEAVDVLTRIDPTPVNGFNLILRVVSVLAEIGENEDVKSFFGYSEQTKKQNESSGFHMVNTEAEEN